MRILASLEETVVASYQKRRYRPWIYHCLVLQVGSMGPDSSEVQVLIIGQIVLERAGGQPVVKPRLFMKFLVCRCWPSKWGRAL